MFLTSDFLALGDLARLYKEFACDHPDVCLACMTILQGAHPWVGVTKR